MTTISERSTAHGEDELFQASIDRLMLEKRNDVEEKNNVTFTCCPIFHSGKVQEKAANTKSELWYSVKSW